MLEDLRRLDMDNSKPGPSKRIENAKRDFVPNRSTGTLRVAIRKVCHTILTSTQLYTFFFRDFMKESSNQETVISINLDKY